MSHPGKTAPRLIEDLYNYNPRYDSVIGRNILTDPPPLFEERDVHLQTLPKHACRHTFLLKDNQSELPRDDDPQWTLKVAAICKTCRVHVDLILNSQAKGQADPEGYLQIRVKPPQLKADYIRLLQDPACLRKRLEDAIRENPERQDLQRSEPVEVLEFLSTYLRDVLAPNRTRNRIPAKNRRFLVSFGNDLDDLFRDLGFKDVYEGSDRDKQWIMPDVPEHDALAVDTPRTFIEDVREEVLTIIDRKPGEQKAKLTRGLKVSSPAISHIHRLLGCHDYEKTPAARRAADQSAEEHPYYASLGAVGDFADDLVYFAYRRQAECDAVNSPYYFECLEGIAEGRKSENLQTKTAILASEGKISRKDVDRAYAYFGIEKAHVGVLSDEHIIGQFQSRLQDAAPAQEGTLREMLRVIGQARQSETIKQAASNTIETYEQALNWLNAEKSTDDNFLISLYQLKTNDAQSNQEIGHKAIEIIARHRRSEKLYTWLASGELTEGEPEMDVGRAFAILQFPDRTAIPDEQLLNALLLTRIEEAPTRREEFEQAYQILCRTRANGDPGIAGEVSFSIDSRPPEKWPVGFHNIGNTCYLNSLLQFYFTVKPLRDLVINHDKAIMDMSPENLRRKQVGSRKITAKEVTRAQEFVRELGNLFEGMITSPDLVVKPEVRLACLTLLASSKDMASRRKSTITGDRPSLGEIDGMPVMGPVMRPASFQKIEETAEEATSPASHTAEAGDSHSDVTLVGGDERRRKSVDVSMEDAVKVSKPQDGVDVKNADTPTMVESPNELSADHLNRIASPDRSVPLVDGAGKAQSVGNGPDQQQPNGSDSWITKTENEASSSIADKPEPPSRPPPVPPRPKPAEKENDIEDAVFAARQQDVTEVIDNVLFQLECAIQADDIDEDGEQIDIVVWTHLKAKSVETKQELFNNLIVDVAEGPRDIYDALDALFDRHTVDLEDDVVPRYATIAHLPPFLQINVHRVGFDRERGVPYKVENHLTLEDVIYLDRYMRHGDTAKDEQLETKRQANWRYKDVMKQLKEVNAHLSRTETELDAAETLSASSELICSINGANGSGGDVHTDHDAQAKFSKAELLQNAEALKDEAVAIKRELEELSNVIGSPYEDMKGHPYRLHSLFMHRGTAKGGHYWIYIHDFTHNVWRKYNDSVVTEVTDMSEIFGQVASNPPTPYFIVYVRDDKKEELVDALCRHPAQPARPADVEMTDAEESADSTNKEQMQVIDGVEYGNVSGVGWNPSGADQPPEQWD
ncbi:hypothetical protein BDY21DRAFT_370337 [Lineolata rhizophorae]|uniref:ubiquitinyl hydrolase 1 n=1 Tax=Lineolata rhizophorae TaxID=578093 RepID=A0A6A6P6N3_9PEZI|nr:hypothetical protein BDY21DRAFT_370337 [Lineolata rhizophorae]